MEYNSFVGSIPWPIAAATALWFGLLAWKSRKTVVLWAIGGGVLGLVLSTLVLGLAQATFIPFHTGEIASFRLKMTVLAVLLVAGVGWLFTGSIHRRTALAREKAAEASSPTPPASPTQPPAAPGKP